MLRAGEFYTGLWPVGSGKKRRFVLVTDEDSELCSLVWVFTSTQMGDDTVVLPSGCHPVITQDCCVVYEQACIVKSSDIVQATADGALQKHPDLALDLLKRIQEGLFESAETSDEVVEYCTDRI